MEANQLQTNTRARSRAHTRTKSNSKIRPQCEKSIFSRVVGLTEFEKHTSFKTKSLHLVLCNTTLDNLQIVDVWNPWKEGNLQQTGTDSYISLFDIVKHISLFYFNKATDSGCLSHFCLVCIHPRHVHALTWSFHKYGYEAADSPCESSSVSSAAAAA